MLAAKVSLEPVHTQLIAKIPFDSQYKYMAIHFQLADEEIVMVTGAPDVLFALCQQQQTARGVEPFVRSYWEAEMARFASQGLRMVAAATKPANVGQKTLDHSDLQDGLVFLGIAGMMDPPRPEAVDAIHTCQNAGSA